MDMTKIYAEHYKNVLGTARSFLRNKEDAEDAAQETFLEATVSMDSYDNTFAISTWLNRICANKCRDMLRRRKLENKSFVKITDYNSHILDSQETEDSPENLLQAEEDINKIFCCFFELPENIRTAVSLRLSEGLSYKELAAQMDAPLGTVKTWVRRGRTKLLQVISPS